jgi:hypothetical protein
MNTVSIVFVPSTVSNLFHLAILSLVPEAGAWSQNSRADPASDFNFAKGLYLLGLVRLSIPVLVRHGECIQLL